MYNKYLKINGKISICINETSNPNENLIGLTYEIL